MPVTFNRIPANYRLPGVVIEVDPSKASRSDDPGRLLLVAQKLATGTAAANVPTPVTSLDDAKAQFGVGSMLADMVGEVRLADPFGLLWALPLADAGGAVSATGTITVTAAPTAPGVIPLYVGGVSVPVPVAGTETLTTTAAAIAAAINANLDLPVTAAPAVVVTLTAAQAHGQRRRPLRLAGRRGWRALPASMSERSSRWPAARPTNITTGMAAWATRPRLHRHALHRRDEPQRRALPRATYWRWSFIACCGAASSRPNGPRWRCDDRGLGRNDPHHGMRLQPVADRSGAGLPEIASAAVVLRNDPAWQSGHGPGRAGAAARSTGRSPAQNADLAVSGMQLCRLLRRHVASSG